MHYRKPNRGLHNLVELELLLFVALFPKVFRKKMTRSSMALVPRTNTTLETPAKLRMHVLATRVGRSAQRLRKKNMRTKTRFGELTEVYLKKGLFNMQVNEAFALPVVLLPQ